MTKTCAGCLQDKPITEYGSRKNQQGRTYLRTSCRDCDNATVRANREYRSKRTTTQKVTRASIRAEMAISYEIDKLIRGTKPKTGTSAPLPTEEDLRAWYEAGCRI
jgi:hypothetical protein